MAYKSRDSGHDCRSVPEETTRQLKGFVPRLGESHRQRICICEAVTYRRHCAGNLHPGRNSGSSSRHGRTITGMEDQPFVDHGAGIMKSGSRSWRQIFGFCKTTHSRFAAFHESSNGLRGGALIKNKRRRRHVVNRPTAGPYTQASAACDGRRSFSSSRFLNPTLVMYAKVFTLKFDL